MFDKKNLKANIDAATSKIKIMPTIVSFFLDHPEEDSFVNSISCSCEDILLRSVIEVFKAEDASGDIVLGAGSIVGKEASDGCELAGADPEARIEEGVVFNDALATFEPTASFEEDSNIS